MPRLSIRGRLTLWFTGLLAATLVILGGVFYAVLMWSLWHDVDSTLTGVAKAMADSARVLPLQFMPPEVQSLLRRYFGPHFAERYYRFLDPGGQLDPRWPHDAGQALTLTRDALTNALQGDATFDTVPGPGRFPVRTITFPVQTDGQTTSVLQIGMSLGELYQARQRFLWALATVGPVALLLAGGSGWLLARRALRPVDLMTAAARRIGAEDLSQRLAGSDAPDELGRLARTLNGMLVRLEGAFAQTRQFAADASHELRTPLTVLRGEIEVALRNPRTPMEYTRVLHSALDEVARMTRLVEELLLLSRADAGALRLDTGPVELDSLVEEVSRHGAVLGQARGVEVRLQTLEPITAHGDAHRLKQVVLNLVDNAVKYTPPGGRVTIDLSRKPAVSGGGGKAEIAVHDTGVGIPAEALPRVFERFYRGDPARTRGTSGAGLGLCIAKSIAEAHGGTIAVDSAPGAGSTFTVSLPLAA